MGLFSNNLECVANFRHLCLSVNLDKDPLFSDIFSKRSVSFLD